MHKQHNPNADQHSAQKNRRSPAVRKKRRESRADYFFCDDRRCRWLCCQPVHGVSRRDCQHAGRLQQFVATLDAPQEAISLPRYGLHVHGLFRRISQRQPQFIYGGINVGVIIHKRAARPQARTQRFAGHNFARSFNKCQQHLEYFARDADSRSFLKQLLALQINLKLAKTQVPFRCFRFAQLLPASA